LAAVPVDGILISYHRQYLPVTCNPIGSIPVFTEVTGRNPQQTTHILAHLQGAQNLDTEANFSKEPKFSHNTSRDFNS